MTSYGGILDNCVCNSVMICLVACFEVSVAMVIKIKACCLVISCWNFGELCCLHFQGILKRGSSKEEMVALYRERAGWVMGVVCL